MVGFGQLHDFPEEAVVGITRLASQDEGGSEVSAESIVAGKAAQIAAVEILGERDLFAGEFLVEGYRGIVEDEVGLARGSEDLGPEECDHRARRYWRRCRRRAHQQPKG